MDLRIHPSYVVGAAAAWGVSVAGLWYEWPYAFEGGLAAATLCLGAGLVSRRGPRAPRPKLASRREMVKGGALKATDAPELAGSAAPRPGPKAPPTIAPRGGALDPIPLEVVGVGGESGDDLADLVVVAAEEEPRAKGVPWARAEAAGPLMFEGHAPLASESMRRVWAARDAAPAGGPEQVAVRPTGVIHGVCGRCGTRISVADRRPVWATCPVCGHSKLLN